MGDTKGDLRTFRWRRTTLLTPPCLSLRKTFVITCEKVKCCHAHARGHSPAGIGSEVAANVAIIATTSTAMTRTKLSARRLLTDFGALADLSELDAGTTPPPLKPSNYFSREEAVDHCVAQVADFNQQVWRAFAFGHSSLEFRD